MLARYVCNRCKHQWELPITMSDAKGKVYNPADECPKCGSFYFAWDSYNEYSEKRD